MAENKEEKLGNVNIKDLDTSKFTSFIRDPKTGKIKGKLPATKPALSTKQKAALVAKEAKEAKEAKAKGGK